MVYTSLVAYRLGEQFLNSWQSADRFSSRFVFDFIIISHLCSHTSWSVLLSHDKQTTPEFACKWTETVPLRRSQSTCSVCTRARLMVLISAQINQNNGQTQVQLNQPNKKALKIQRYQYQNFKKEKALHFFSYCFCQLYPKFSSIIPPLLSPSVPSPLGMLWRMYLLSNQVAFISQLNHN